ADEPTFLLGDWPCHSIARPMRTPDRRHSMAHPDLSPGQRAQFEAAAALIDIERLYRVNREITAIHSPTGRERAASAHMTRYLTEIGLEATYQPMGDASGNAIGRIRGS